METKKAILKEVIETIQFELRMKINWLNYGGCGFFAIIMYAYMKKYGFDCKIIFYSNRDRKRYDEVFNDVIQNKNFESTSLLSASHVLIEYDNDFFDGHYYNQKNIDFEITGEFTQKELAIALKYGGWNSHYTQSKRENNKIIKQVIKNEFENCFGVTNLSLNP